MLQPGELPTAFQKCSAPFASKSPREPTSSKCTPPREPTTTRPAFKLTTTKKLKPPWTRPINLERRLPFIPTVPTARGTQSARDRFPRTCHGHGRGHDSSNGQARHVLRPHHRSQPLLPGQLAKDWLCQRLSGENQG